MKNEPGSTTGRMRARCSAAGWLTAFLVSGLSCAGTMHVEPERLNVWAGETVRVTVGIAAEDRSVGEIAWAAGALDTAIASGTARVTSGSAEFDVTAPDAERVVSLVIEIAAAGIGGEDRARERITVFPRIRDEEFKAAFAGVRPRVLDPGGHLRSFLDGAGIPHTAVRSWAALPDDEPRGLVLVGPGALAQGRIAPGDLLAEPAHGAEQTVLVFLHESIPMQWHDEWFRRGIEIRRPVVDVSSATLDAACLPPDGNGDPAANAAIPWLRDLDDDAFRAWRGGRVGRALFERPHMGNAEAGLVAGGSPLVLDVRRGSRRVLLCQCPVIEAREDEPAAAYLLGGLLQAAAREAPRRFQEACRLEWGEAGGDGEEDRWIRIGLGIESFDGAALLHVREPDAEGAWFLAGVPPARLREWSQQNLAAGEILTRFFDAGGKLLVAEAGAGDIGLLRELAPEAADLLDAHPAAGLDHGPLEERFRRSRTTDPTRRIHVWMRLDEAGEDRLLFDRLWVDALTRYGIALQRRHQQPME